MELLKEETNNLKKIVPKVPIKTYQWEDVRRSRLKGGYPWTYLTKEPFFQDIDPKPYRMDFTKNKETNDNTDELPKFDENSLIIIREASSEPDDPSKKQQYEEMELDLTEADSCDNISQYLDKEERIPIKIEKSTKEFLEIPNPSSSTNDNRKRAKSEEPPKRKRKLSIDSSYSRKSLSKLAIIKKMKDAKEKIKFPNICIKKSNTKKDQKKSTSEVETKKLKIQSKPPENPVYIHIPLKPPEGQTDEFSYLEFEEKKPQIDESTKSPDESPKQNIETPKEITQLPERRFSDDNPDEIVAIEILKSESIEIDGNETNGLHNNGDIFIIQQNPENSTNDDVAIIILGDESTAQQQNLKRIDSRRVRAKSEEPPRKRKLSAESSYSRKSLSKLGWLSKKIREGKEKLRLPIFSSLSRSSSKRSTKDSLSRSSSKRSTKESLSRSSSKRSTKDSLSRLSSKKSIKDKDKKQESIPVDVKNDTNKIDKSTNDEPKYIHIPLKPPPGQTDEFSHLEFENKHDVKKEETPKEIHQQTSVESPIPSDDNNNIQFIYLTPPSDDEILADVEIPETPSSDGQFFETKIKELKEIAKDVVNQVSPETKRKKLESVTEEKSETKKIIIDEEDGLKSTEPESRINENDNIKEIKTENDGTAEKSDIKSSLKKKVSFKRRSRDDTQKEGDYEEIKGSDKTNIECGPPRESEESLAINDEAKLKAISSAKDDPDKWSKSSDHEYEVVNPPPDDILLKSVFFDEKVKPSSKASSTTSLERRMLGVDIIETIPDKKETLQNIKNNNEVTKESLKIDTTKSSSKSSSIKSKKSEGPGKFQQVLKAQTDKFKNTFHGIKKPHINLPSKSNFKFQTPKFHLPTIPDRTKINLPSFNTITKKHSAKRTLKQRQYSTESNVGDSKKKYFDFSTYPRIFKKKQPVKKECEVDFATVPRVKKNDEKLQQKDRWSGRDSIRIPLKPEDSLDNEDKREDSVEKRMASHIQYNQDIDIDDAYEKENEEIHKISPFSGNYNDNNRWSHGNFHPKSEMKNQDTDENEQIPNYGFDINKETHSSESSIHQRGVLEEIDSDEFFLRQKGISQDNIEVGMYLSSEIREAFKSPSNALSDIQRDSHRYEITGSNQSLPETTTKKKSIKKPKRKKTPHVSQEDVSFDQDSEQEQCQPPSRPKRRSKKSKKTKSIIPYEEAISCNDNEDIIQYVDDDLEFDKENFGSFNKSDDDQYKAFYENEQMQGKEQPEITITDPYRKQEDEKLDYKPPTAPKRKKSLKSLKSLSTSEHDSLFGEIIQNIGQEEIPVRPQRTRSRSSLQIFEKDEEPPQRPSRSRTRSVSQTASQQDSQSQMDEECFQNIITQMEEKPTEINTICYGNQEPCIEEPCVQQLCDYMGYAIIDKSKQREPPLPPPRITSRSKRSVEVMEDDPTKFFTVPRQQTTEIPARPIRNYSTLGPNRPSRKKNPVPNLTDEEKQHFDTTQYVEIEDEPNRSNLQSGEILQKMKDRPLPPPPRPPRKNKYDDNFEENVSTQTEPLPDDFICEDIIQEPTDKILTPTTNNNTDKVIERRLITPTNYYEETVTHGSIVIAPLDGAKILPDSEITKREHTIKINREIDNNDDDDDDETSEIPDDFKKLKSYPNEDEKCKKIQITDLDVDRLSVNELLASKIIVSEIDSGSIQTNEINSKSGVLKIGEIELPPSVIQQLLEKLQPNSTITHIHTDDGGSSSQIVEDDSSGQKKNFD